MERTEFKKFKLGLGNQCNGGECYWETEERMISYFREGIVRGAKIGLWFPIQAFVA